MNFDDLQKAVEHYKTHQAESVIGSLNPDMAKASFGSPLATGAGLQMYNLLPTALTIYPVLTPLRNKVPRLQGKGIQPEYKAIVGASNTGLSGAFAAEGVAAGQIGLNVVDIKSTYRTLSQGGAVTFQAQWTGAGYVDAKATEVVNTLRQLMILEEQAILFGQNSVAAAAASFAPGLAGAPTAPANATWAAAPAGTTMTAFGSAPANLRLTQLTGFGESTATSSFLGTFAAGVPSFVLPARTAGQPIQGYHVYAGTNSSAQVYVQVGTSPNVYVQCPIDSTGAALIPAVAGATVLVGNVLTSNTAPSSDGTGSALSYDGLFPQLYAASTASATNNGFGPVIQSANAGLTATGYKTSSLNFLLKQMWDINRADPDWLYLQSSEAISITELTLGNGTPYLLAPEGDQSSFVGGYRVGRLANPVTGKLIQVNSHPYFNQGVILAGSDSLPDWYTPSDTPAPFALDMVQDYTEVDYPPTAPKWTTDIMNMGTLRTFIPVLFGIMDSILPPAV